MSYIRYLSMGSLLAPLSLLTYHVSAEITSIDPTPSYVPQLRTNLQTTVNLPVFNSAIQQAPPYFYFTAEKVYRLGPDGNWGWVDNDAGINPIMQGP